MSAVSRLAAPVLAAVGGLCLGEAIREAVHHGHSWPVLAGIAVAAWTGSAVAIWLPYLAERRQLLRQRAFLLRVSDEVPAMVAQALAEQAAAENRR